MMTISIMMISICILLSVAFFTLFERKVLGYTHNRIGPNKNFIYGILQPINDLIKLFNKIDYKMGLMQLMMFILIPCMMTLISLIMWLYMYRWGDETNMKYYFIILMCLNGMSVFFFLAPGWSSGSFYSTLGSYRTSAQVISYEGIFFFSIMIFLFFLIDYSMNLYNYISSLTFFFSSMLYFMIPWLCSILAESNRSPFDFAEGESELVSGFNTEYSGGFFSLIFLSEYMSIMFLCFFSSLIFSQISWMNLFIFMMMLFFYVWVRVSFPRLRYDKLMLLSWKSLMFLITSLGAFYFFLIFF